MRLSRFLLLLPVLLGPTLSRAAEPPSPAQLASIIDSRLLGEWTSEGVRPAAPVDDAAFLRRASLDLIGRVPTVAEVRLFLADKSPDRRASLVGRLIESGAHTRHMATFWRRTWVPQADTAEFSRLADGFEAWIAGELQKKTPLDRMVRSLLTQANPEAMRRGEVSPAGFFAASENRPENLAANATRAFLGVNLDCAQCHDHPFARWTRDEFWQTAAFFAPPGKSPAGKVLPPTLQIPNTERSLEARLLTGKPASWPEVLTSDTGRQLLAGWLVAPDNPYFARNAVNRLWAHLYGSALVEPLDDLSGESSNDGFHAELLKELADAFTASGYDLRYLTRTLVLTRAYQLSAGVNDKPDEPRLFARMPIRGLTGEQLYDSLRTAAGLASERADVGQGQGLDARKRFATQFLVARTVSAERSIPQTLALMNGAFTAELTDPSRNPTLVSIVEAPFLDTAARVELLFLAAVSRKPLQHEVEFVGKYVQSGGPTKSERQALADVFWALMNSSEFNTNH